MSVIDLDEYYDPDNTDYDEMKQIEEFIKSYDWYASQFIKFSKFLITDSGKEEKIIKFACKILDHKSEEFEKNKDDIKKLKKLLKVKKIRNKKYNEVENPY